MDSGFYLFGQVLKVEQISGNRADGSSYSFTTVHVLADVEVYECTVGRQFKGQLPQKGDSLGFLVSVRAFKGGGNGLAKLGIDLLGVAGQVEDENAPTRALASV